MFSLFIIVCIIFVAMKVKRNIERENEKINLINSPKKRKMDERKNNQPTLVPVTERRVSGSNWEKFKKIVFETPNLSTECPKPSDKLDKKNNKTKEYSHAPAPELNKITCTKAKTVNTEHNNEKKITKEVAMDCEMVGIGDGTESMIARVSLVNRYGVCLYDKYVKPREKIKDYRTAVSGIRKEDLENGEEFAIVQKEVADILRGRILVGHALKNDLDVLYLSHPRRKLRDTSRYKRFRQMLGGGTPSLKKLTHELLGKDIQTGEHNSVEDAVAAMQLYVLFKKEWESDIHPKSERKLY